MITFHTIDVSLQISQSQFKKWLVKVAKSEGKRVGTINYVFCNDSYLLGVNQKYLNHDTYTDIITFDNSSGDFISADIYISSERVTENALINNVDFINELLRVVVHGLLHLCGYKDKTDDQRQIMRLKEDEKTALFHVER